MESISFKFKYKGELAGKPYERKPVLFWWTSTIRSFNSGVSQIKIKWEDKKNQISKESIISIPIQPSINNERYRLDDRIWVQCFVKSPSEEGYYVGARAGSASISLKTIYDSVKSSGNFREDNLVLNMPQMKDSDGNPYKKGNIQLTLAKEEASKILKNWKFDENQGPYDLAEGNKEKMNKIFNMTINSSLFPYSETASNNDLQFKASVSFIESIHAPLWVSNINVPGWVYWVNYSKYEPDELFWENLAKVALGRNSVSREWFLKIATSQLKKMNEEYDDNFNTIVAITMEAITIPSISLYYKSDESYSVQLKNGFFSGNGITITKKSIESFNDALTMLGDDCEGLGALIHRVMHILKTGIPSRKGNQPWNINGGWKDPVLQKMQHLVYWYISGGSLGSVTAARVGGAEAINKPLIIDSREDKNARLGAHMWQESMSIIEFEERMRKTNSKLTNFKLREANYPKWLSNLPHTVGEGTGSVYPFLRPIGEYYKDINNKNLKIVQNQKKLASMKLIIENCQFLSMGQIQRIQKMNQNEPDARFSDFYRRTTNFITDELYKQGLLTAELIWTQIFPRVSENVKTDDSNLEQPWTWGANMRDKLQFEKREGKKLGLLIVPPITIQEKETILSLLRHLPPLQTPTLSPERKRELEDYAKPFIEQFQKIVDTYTKDRRSLGDQQHPTFINIIFRKEEFFRGMINPEEKTTLRDGLLSDIKNIKKIYKVNTIFEPITNQIYNVRLQVYVNVNDNDVLISSSSIVKSRNLFSIGVKWKKQIDYFEEIHHFKDVNIRFAFHQGILQNQKSLTNPNPIELKMYTKGFDIVKERKKLGFEIQSINLEDNIENYLEF